MTIGVTARPASAPDRPGALPDRLGWAVAALAAVIALGLLLLVASVAVTPPGGAGDAYAPAFRDALDGPAAMMNRHDGQAFASLALDPLLSHPEDWSEGAPAMAYRASRPLLGWLVMLTSFGSSDRAASSLVLWTAGGIGLVAAGAALLARRWHRSPDWIPLLLALPGIAGQILFPGLSDGIATGLVLFGLAWWIDRRDRWAVAAFCLAALSRETTLLVPLALLLPAGWRRGRVLLLPLAAYVGWVGIVWLRLHALPSDASQGTLGLPFEGMLEAVPTWNWVAWTSALTVVALGVVAYRRAPNREIRLVVLAFAAFGTTMDAAVWVHWHMSRPLLPLAVMGACLLARDRSADEAEEDVTAPAAAV